jgi:hypothetical protein
VNGVDPIDSFELDDYLLLDEEIESVTAIDPDTFVDDGQSDLALKREASLSQFIDPTRFVGGFEKTWAQRAVHLDTRHPAVSGEMADTASGRLAPSERPSRWARKPTCSRQVSLPFVFPHPVANAACGLIP